MEVSLWKLEAVTLTGTPRPRLAEVDLEIPAGVTAVVGQSGAGKTSLLNLLVGFERPDAGTVNATFPRSDERLPLFWVPQNLGLWPHLTVAEHLHAVISPANHESNSTVDDRVVSLLAEFDLSELADARPDRLSQGERSRLSVARAVASGAAVLVMDEPLAHVNPSRVGRYWDVLRRHVRESGASLVIATHSPETVLREAEYAVCLSEGRVLYVGPVDELYWRPASVELAEFLGAHNWLSAEEAGQWLNLDDERSDGESADDQSARDTSATDIRSVRGTGEQATAEAARDRCLRPEQIAVVEAQDSPLIVESSRFAGSVGEVELRDERTGHARRFFHRPSRNGLPAGARVVLKVLALLLFCLLSVGCTEGGGEAWNVKRSWAMPADGVKIPAPRAVHATSAGELYILDDAGRVLVYDLDGQLLRQWRMPESEVGNPEGLCLLSDGRIAVADTHYHRVVFFDSEGKVLGMLGSLGKGPGQFIYPVAIVADDAGNFYVGEYGENDRVQKFSPEGKFLLQFGGFGTGPGEFQRPSGLVWHEERIYAVDAFNNRIQVFSDDGEFLGILGEKEESPGLHYPYDISQDAAGVLYVVEYAAGRVSRFDLEGRLIDRFGTTGTGSGQFKTPWGLTVGRASASSPVAKPQVFVADTGNRRIVELEL